MLNNAIHIVAVGARTVVGRTAETSASSARAGISRLRLQEHVRDSAGEPLRGALDADLDPRQWVGWKRLAALAQGALQDLAGKLPKSLPAASRIPLFLALPEARPGHSASDASEVSRGIETWAQDASFPIQVQREGEGHAGGLQALETGMRSLSRSGGLCLVGGVDSYWHPSSLGWLDEERRLARTGSRSGFPPGEASAMLLLADEVTRHRLGLPSLAVIRKVALAREQRSAQSDEGLLGEALTEVIRRACEGGVPVDAIYCDINGERQRTDEWGFTLLRVGAGMRNGSDYVSKVDAWGEVGAATPFLNCVLAVEAWRRQYSRGPGALIWGSSWGGLRGAALLEEGVGPPANRRQPKELLITPDTRTFSANLSVYSDVIEEHIDNAAFLFEKWQSAFVLPQLSLEDLKATVEARLLAHLDALTQRDPETDRRLWVELEADAEAPRVSVAVLALLYRELGELAERPHPAEALTRLGEQLDRDPSSVRVEAALQAFDVFPWEERLPRGLQAFRARHRLSSEAASRDSAVRAEAARMALGHGRSSPFPGLEDDDRWALMAASADPSSVQRLLGELATPSAPPRALWAAGFSGRVECIDACVPYLAASDEALAKLAFEAVCAFAGLNASDARWIRAEEEDLDAALPAGALSYLPLPNAPAVTAWWNENRPNFTPRRRYLKGRPYSSENVAAALTRGPLRRRQVIAAELFVRSNGGVVLPKVRLGPHSLPPIPELSWDEGFPGET